MTAWESLSFVRRHEVSWERKTQGQEAGSPDQGRFTILNRAVGGRLAENRRLSQHLKEVSQAAR